MDSECILAINYVINYTNKYTPYQLHPIDHIITSL
jgi:hypothetical protein